MIRALTQLEAGFAVNAKAGGCGAPDEPIKEYQIATEVYGRPPDFDPQSDSTIRVQARRLRLKLAEYYAGEGAADPIVVAIPKVTTIWSRAPCPSKGRRSNLHRNHFAGRLTRRPTFA